MTMTSIKSLPEALRSSVRSGIILFDITRVVEELIFNALDAGASKVSVFVGVETCYVRVEDDGSGITRDGLVLLGERYATSKFDHLVGEDTKSGTFGFRGEALASISDVSLLEVVTKACGRPNGYRKVMKGSKCLYLGICDDRTDMGTTVVVRDLFYNQPVRRKYIRSSPKKILQSIKKCVLRIALVHSKVSFKVVDIESEDVLFCTHPSSGLSLLTSYFGIEVSTSLHELNISDSKVKFSGYISGPCDDLTIKAFQYVYINSRFVCKGPIHKLVNQLATRYECDDQGKAVGNSQNRKRSRPQTYPAFILNISCPRSFYDLTFEPSKAHVEFKDWVPVLTLLDEAIQRLWKENISFDFHDDDFPRNSTIGKKKCRIKNRRDSLDLISSHVKMSSKEDNCLSHSEQDITPNQCSHKYVNYFEKQENEMDPIFQVDNSVQAWDHCLSKCMSEISKDRENQPYISDNSSLSTEDYFSVNKVTSGEGYHVNADDGNFSSVWGKDSFEVNLAVFSGSAGTAVCHDCQEFSDDVGMSTGVKKPFLKNCSLQENLQQERTFFKDDGFTFQSDGFKIKRTLTNPYDRVDISETNDSNQSFDILPRNLWQDQASNFQPFPRVIKNSNFSAEFGCLPRDFVKSIPLYEEHFDENDDFSCDSVSKVETIGSDHLNLGSEWCSLTSDSISKAKPWDLEHYTDINILGDSGKSIKTASNRLFMDRDESDSRYSLDVLEKRFSQELCTSYSGLADAGSGRFLQRHNLIDDLSPECIDTSTDETDWLSLDSHSKNHIGIEMYKSQRDAYTCKKRERKLHFSKGRPRSHSAPPFCRSKRRFFTLNYHSTEKADNSPTYPEAHDCRVTALGDSLLDSRLGLKNLQDSKEDKKKIKNDEGFEQSVYFDVQDDAPLKEIISKEFQDSLNCQGKWRNCFQQTVHNYKLHEIHNQDNILDISSGFLHLAGDSLVPESISKNCLENAVVLQQVDKKFIPVVAGRTLAVVDQHAADERIRLEELRQKVFSGEAKTTTYLDAEQELILPEIGHQLLHNYAEEIKEWGWICDIQAQDSKSFKRSLNLLHRQPRVVALTGVPCILGVNLSDEDLVEFLQQLADTDGSSTIPPSVLRILNSKACRGAIMFGDSLLRSECCVIVEELKQSSLCFQCAHGRPTTAPLVNLEALHKQIAKLNDDSDSSCHGLRRHQISLQRASQRLSSTT